MPAISRFIRAALDPLIAITLLGMVISGGVLVSNGLWGSLWTCILGFFLSPLIFPFLMMPAAFLAGLMGIADRRQKPVASKILQAASVGWLVFILSLWGALVFALSGPMLADPALLWTAMLWCVSAAAAPWAVFARSDKDNILFSGLVMMFWAGCIAASAYGITAAPSFWARFGVIAGVTAALALAMALYEEFFLKDKKG